MEQLKANAILALIHLTTITMQWKNKCQSPIYLLGLKAEHWAEQVTLAVGPPPQCKG